MKYFWVTKIIINDSDNAFRDEVETNTINSCSVLVNLVIPLQEAYRVKGCQCLAFLAEPVESPGDSLLLDTRPHKPSCRLKELPVPWCQTPAQVYPGSA